VSKFLRENLFSLNDASQAQLDLFANTFEERLMPILMRSVLDPSIPEDKTELDKYQTTSEKMLQFDHAMKHEGLTKFSSCCMKASLIPLIGLFYPENLTIIEFVSKINLLYARRRRSSLLVTVRQIIESEDQNTAEVTDATERGNFVCNTREDVAAHMYIGSLNTLHAIRMGQEFSKNADGGISNGKAGYEKQGQEINDCSFRLPTCHVSVQAQTLVELAYNTLSEAVSLDQER
jgi:hypothetical protein